MTTQITSKTKLNDNEVFARLESNVRSYARSFPALFNYARGTELRDVQAPLSMLLGSGAKTLQVNEVEGTVQVPATDLERLVPDIADLCIETLDQNGPGQHLFPSCGFVEVARQLHFAMPLARGSTVGEPK